MRQDAEVVAMVCGGMDAQPVLAKAVIAPHAWLHNGWVKRIAAFAVGALLVLGMEDLASGRLGPVRWPSLLPMLQVPAKTVPGTAAPSARRGASPTALA